MKYRHILVPYDGSDHAQSAFTIARSIALESDDAEVFVLNVVPMAWATSLSEADPFTGGASSFLDQEGYSELIDNSLKNIEKEMQDTIYPLCDGLPHERCHIEAITHPSPVHGIEEYANQHDCDLIVMGRRGLGAIRGMLGSVSYGVLRNVDIPVLTVK